MTSHRPQRRRIVKSIASLLACGALPAGVTPFAIGKTKPIVRVLGTHVTLQEALRQKAMADLGITLTFAPGGSAEVLQKAVMNPTEFDLYEQWSNSIRVLWQAGAIQAIEKKRLTYWDEINSLTKTGKLTDYAKFGAGDAPYRILHVQDNGSLDATPTDYISYLPYVHNVDSFGYNQRFVSTGIEYETESWAWLLDSQYSRLTGIVNAPTIGLFDLALAAQAKGYVSFNDIGNMSKSEIDALFAILSELKQINHFNGFWTSVPESIEFMRTERVVIESMFSPAATSLKASGIPVRFAAPKEGYRGWHGVMCLSSVTDGRVKDAAYEYMNWWLSGWAGAFIARQGYYISVPQRAKTFLSQAEWDYWYGGKPAAEPLRGTDNRIAVQRGETRVGGSYEKRFSNVAVWNTVMDTYEYSLHKWYEFITA